MGYSVDGRHRDNILDDNVPVENQPAWFDGYMFTQEWGENDESIHLPNLGIRTEWPHRISWSSEAEIGESENGLLGLSIGTVDSYGLEEALDNITRPHRSVNYVQEQYITAR